LFHLSDFLDLKGTWYIPLAKGATPLPSRCILATEKQIPYQKLLDGQYFLWGFLEQSTTQLRSEGLSWMTIRYQDKNRQEESIRSPARNPATPAGEAMLFARGR